MFFSYLIRIVTLSFLLTSAPRSINTLTIAITPSLVAAINGVSPYRNYNRNKLVIKTIQIEY